MIYIVYTILLSSLLFCLSDEQIEKIKLKTDEADYAPNFTLDSIEDRDFSEIKNFLSSIAGANILFEKEKGKLPNTIKDLFVTNT